MGKVNRAKETVEMNSKRGSGNQIKLTESAKGKQSRVSVHSDATVCEEHLCSLLGGLL